MRTICTPAVSISASVFAETITRLHISLADAPFFEIPAHALQLHFELACVPHGVAVPGVGGGELRQQVDKPLAQSTLGQVGILHIHKVFGVKTADGFEHIGADGGKAAGAKLNGAGIVRSSSCMV